ncbi:N(5)-(carboxyethyl)ornithine synthase [uncultured Robinsoniella sp.]|uniref:N(5)-(carboxyethyl)ornithine synthase n=1 Tax=uncultured Robinsoniella sp. TaxID=904190 RepID=UPI00374FA0B8
MKTIGFPISHKENEYRRAIVPEDIKKLKHPQNLYFEYGYGKCMGIEDSEFSELGCNLAERENVLSQDIICDPKIGDAEYLEKLSKGQTIFGWIHATQNKDITDKIMSAGLSAYAWEKMYNMGRHIFWRNNELAGEAAVMHAFQCYGRMPYETKVAVIGGGNTARGAVKVLNMLGARVTSYSRHTEKLLKRELTCYDVIVNCVLWDVTRRDHIICKNDLHKMKRNSMIIDVSCDKNGAIETSIPTTIDNPIYQIEGIIHYVVDHTPSLFYKTFTYENSSIVYPFIEELMMDDPGNVLKKSCIFEKGSIVDKEIIEYQAR